MYQIVHEKIKNIFYKELKMQDYLAEGDRNSLVSKVIYKARGQVLDIKMKKNGNMTIWSVKGVRIYNGNLSEQIEVFRLFENNMKKRENMKNSNNIPYGLPVDPLSAMTVMGNQ